ncbi:hypothetical protein [Nocardioides sp.]|uniref:hypothetical protein n=1 Tax=Nocardioides sp. TaxID=35761 RepID=UPI00273697B4|nr:hypothetical protein [Nocardioides sp.]MDP3890632.1 hypothetical protein [Nocardioides sp.]
MNTRPTSPPTTAPGPPPRLHLAIMIWLAVFPTLTVLQLLLGELLDRLPLAARTLTLSTLVVPVVVYLILPHLQRARAALVSRP